MQMLHSGIDQFGCCGNPPTAYVGVIEQLTHPMMPTRKHKTMTYINSVNTIEIDLADRISRNLSSLFDRLGRIRMARRTIRELNALTSRELDDLGLNRSMIKSVAYEAAFSA